MPRRRHQALLAGFHLNFRKGTNMCTVVCDVARRNPRSRQGRPPPRRQPPRSRTELIFTAERLERACDREARIVALDIPDSEAILRVLEDCPDELAELRAVLLQEHVGRVRDGLV